MFAAVYFREELNIRELANFYTSRKFLYLQYLRILNTAASNTNNNMKTRIKLHQIRLISMFVQSSINSHKVLAARGIRSTKCLLHSAVLLFGCWCLKLLCRRFSYLKRRGDCKYAKKSS